MYIICILYVYYMYIICILYVYYVYYMYIICICIYMYVYYIYTAALVLEKASSQHLLIKIKKKQRKSLNQYERLEENTLNPTMTKIPSTTQQ